MTRPTPEVLAHRAHPTPPAADPKKAAPAAATELLTGAQVLVRSLEALGADVVFGIPGGAILPAYDPLFDSEAVRHILVRHEQGAGHAATGYAQATGKVGVCMATSGPGATNLVTPIADAYMDSVAMVAITGQVASASIGTDAFQEADIAGITLPITKHNYLVQSGEELPRVLAEAFHLAGTGRPGPVLVDIPKDVLQKQTTFKWPPTMELPGYHPTLHPHGKQIREAARLIAGAKRPVLYVGGGVIKAHASEVLLKLAELTGAPVVTTLMARGAFPDSHPQHMGMPGMHGTVGAVYALQKSDLLITLGARFDDRVTGELSTFAPNAAVIHADIDPAEIGKNRTADVPIVGDAKHVIEELIAAVTAEHQAGHKPVLKDWWATLDDIRGRYPPRLRGAVRRHAGPAVRDRAHRRHRRPGRHLHGRRRAAPDVGGPVRQVRAPGHLAQLRRPGHHGLRRPRRDGRQGGPARQGGLGDRRRRLLPDDQPGARHLRPGGHPDQGGRHQQRQPGHGPAVADAVLRPAVLQHRARHPQAPHPGLREAGRRARLRGAAL
ncbi:hypothetical protein GCM10020218_044630 [Dactylosporangium vinaceum]